jgi:hypothetical protein
VGIGQQQRADNIYIETTFVSPSYCLAEAFSDKVEAVSSTSIQLQLQHTVQTFRDILTLQH